MMTCAQCFDEHLRAELLAETCRVQNVTHHRSHTEEWIQLHFVCRHNRPHTHRSYRGSADWKFALDQLKTMKDVRRAA